MIWWNSIKGKHIDLKRCRVCLNSHKDTQKVPIDFQRRSWIRTTITDPTIRILTSYSNPDNNGSLKKGQAIIGSPHWDPLQIGIKPQAYFLILSQHKPLSTCSRKRLSSEEQLWHFSANCCLPFNEPAREASAAARVSSGESWHSAIEASLFSQHPQCLIQISNDFRPIDDSRVDSRRQEAHLTNITVHDWGDWRSQDVVPDWLDLGKVSAWLLSGPGGDSRTAPASDTLQTRNAMCGTDIP